MLRVRRHLFHEFLFVYCFLMTLTSLSHYCDILFVALLIPFSYEENVWHIIEQHTTDASIDQWHSRL